MKSYNVDNYLRYRDDLEDSILRLEGLMWDEYPRDELIVKFLPLVENIARKFSTSDQASGVMDITDLIQEGSVGLIQAVDNINWEKVHETDNPIEQTLKSFLSKRIKGAIRRAIDINRGAIKLPEHKLSEIRKNPDNEDMVALFFNSIFSSYDEHIDDEDNHYFNIEDKSSKYNIDLLNKYLLSIMKQYLTRRQYEVLRLSYGLDCDKLPAIEIAKRINILVPTANVIVSQIKKEAIDTLIMKVSKDQIIEYLN